jgi:hypothetical protein
MRRLLSGVLVVCSALGNVAFSQQLTNAAPATTAPPPPNTLLDGEVHGSRCWRRGGYCGCDVRIDDRGECAELRYRGGWELRGEYAFDVEPCSGETRDCGEEGWVSGLVAQHDGRWRECAAECGDGGEVEDSGRIEEFAANEDSKDCC